MKILGITVSKNLAEPKSPYLFPMHTCTYERLAGATDQNNINEWLAASTTASTTQWFSQLTGLRVRLWGVEHIVAQRAPTSLPKA